MNPIEKSITKKGTQQYSAYKNDLSTKIINSAIKNQLTGLVAEDEFFDGRHVTFNNQRYLNFTSCCYLGLELDSRVKEASNDATNRYGTFYSTSRVCSQPPPFREYEDLVTKMFGYPIAFCSNLALGHHGVLPNVINKNDLIILDNEAHASLRDAAVKLQAFGIDIEIIERNSLLEIKKAIVENSHLYDKIWYLTDGLYSMMGDFAPVKELVALANQYEKLHLYFDDAHGTGIMGKNGVGYVLNETPMHPKMILAVSFRKALGAGGAAFVFPTQALCDRVKSTGTAFIFTGCDQPSVMGAGIAVAKIALSDEMQKLQEALAKKIAFCQHLLEEKELPIASDPRSPIFYIGLGSLYLTFNMAERIKESGFFLNTMSYPAVAENRSGLRFTITLHHTEADIRALVEALAYHFPIALAEEGKTLQQIRHVFRKIATFRIGRKEVC